MCVHARARACVCLFVSLSTVDYSEACICSLDVSCSIENDTHAAIVTDILYDP